MTGSHTGELLAQEVLNALNDFDLAEKLFCITTDNASNNGKLMKCLRKLLRIQGIKWSAQKNHISCMNHVLNLAVQAFLKKIKALAPEVDKETMWMEKNAQSDESSEEDEDRDDKEVYHDDEEIELDEDGEESINEESDNILEWEEEDDNSGLSKDDFQTTMKKLCGIAKIWPYSAQCDCTKLSAFNLCATIFRSMPNV